MEFWNSDLTEKSWRILQEFKKEHDFILIGGWATYLWTKQQKSKDIDIVVNIDELQALKKYPLSKNNNLKKYEIKIQEIDIDIYVSYFSKLTILPEHLEKYVKKSKGFKVVSPEALLVLKQGAYEDRKNSVKGEKDKIDIISMLCFSDIELKKYTRILNAYELSNYKEKLLKILREFRDYDSLNLTPGKFKKEKIKLINKLKRL